MNIMLLFLYAIILVFLVISLIKKRRKPGKLLIYAIQLLIFVYILFGLPTTKEKIIVKIYSPYHEYLNDSIVNIFEDSLKKMNIKYEYVNKPDTLWPTIFVDLPYYYETDIPLKGKECGITVKRIGKDSKGIYIDWMIISNDSLMEGYVLRNNDTIYEGNLYNKKGKLYTQDKKLQIFIDDIIKKNNKIILNNIDFIEDTFVIVSYLLNPSARIVKDILNNNSLYLFKSDKGYFIMKNEKLKSINIKEWKDKKYYKYIIVGDMDFPYKGLKIENDLWQNIMKGKEVYDLKRIYSLKKEGVDYSDTLLIKDYKRIKELNRLIGIRKLEIKNINQLKDFLNNRYVIKENMKLKIYLLFLIVILMIVAVFI